MGRPDGCGGSDREARLRGWAYAWGCTGVSLGKATNFLIYFIATWHKSVQSVVKRISHNHSGAWRALPWVTGGNALGIDSILYMMLGGQYAAGWVLISVLLWWVIRQKQEKPLGEDGGRCPAAILPPWSYKSELLTTKSEAYQHLHINEGHHPLQGDKQE